MPKQKDARAARQDTPATEPDGIYVSGKLVISAVVVLALRFARGWAPAVVVAQGVRLVGSLVQRREQPHEEVRQEGTEGRVGLG